MRSPAVLADPFQCSARVARRTQDSPIGRRAALRRFPVTMSTERARSSPSGRVPAAP